MILLSLNVKADNSFEYILNSHFKPDGLQFSFTDGTAYSTFNMLGSWTDNYRNFGSANCTGQIHTNKKNEVKIYGVCEMKDEADIKRWITLERDFGVTEIGVGKSKQIDAEGFWKILTGIDCNYAIKHGKEYSYSITKCKISKDQHVRLSAKK
tara:strand:- start:1311 stop:1769 length:459 start_codon:yes stop_codon:yes gene_type:complete